MMSLQQLITDYGYAAVAIGTFLEGETILALGGFAAHRGYLSLPWVVVCGFVGSLLGDQLYYYIGRWKGDALLARRPAWQQQSTRVFDLLHRHQLWLILGFRFLYGIRTVTPFLIGAARISPLRFLVLNLVGAAVWAVAVGVAGYLFGNALEAVLGDIKRYELALFAGFAVIGVLVWTARRLRARRAQQSGRTRTR